MISSYEKEQESEVQVCSPEPLTRSAVFVGSIWIHLGGEVPFILSGCRSECELLFFEMAKACLPGPFQTAPANPPVPPEGQFQPIPYAPKHV